MFEALLKAVMRPRCPSCDAVQPVMARYGARHRVRRPETIINCPGCGAALRFAARLGLFAELGLSAAAILAGVVVFTAVVSLLVGQAGALSVFLAFVMLPLGAVVAPVLAMGLILRVTRRVER